MNNRSLIYIFTALFLGTLCGFFGKSIEIGGVSFIKCCALLGTLFIQALMLVVLPLVISSVIAGACKMGMNSSFAQLGTRTLGYFFLTNFSAIVIGWLVVRTLRPGDMMDPSLLAAPAVLPQSGQVDLFGKFSELLLKMVPANIVNAAAEGQMLGIIVFCLFFGITMAQMSVQIREGLLFFWQATFEVMMKMTHIVMKFLPIGVFGLVAKASADFGFEAIKPLGFFLITAFIALGAYAFLFLPLLLLLSGINPLHHVRALMPAFITGFTTSSSAATLPVTMECMEKGLGVPNRITSFIIPLSCSLNLSACAGYASVAVFFIAQIYHVPLSIGEELVIIGVTTMTSFGVAGVPSAVIIAIVMILKGVSLPVEGLALLMTVERIVDMIRTVINISGHTVICSSVNAYAKQLDGQGAAVDA